MRLLQTLAFVSGSVLTATFAAPAFAQFDHLQCYPIKDTLPRAKYSADLLPATPTFAAALGCEIKVPAKLVCVAVEKTNVAPTPVLPVEGTDARSVFCYALRCPKGTTIPKGGLAVDGEDQFGHRAFTIKQPPKLLCAPANIGPPTPTPTLTPAPTLTPTATPGGIGSCVDGVGACVCPRPATPTPQPTCTGACPTATGPTPAPTASPPPCGEVFNPPFCSVSTCPFDETCVAAGEVCACATCCPCS